MGPHDGARGPPTNGPDARIPVERTDLYVGPSPDISDRVRAANVKYAGTVCPALRKVLDFGAIRSHADSTAHELARIWSRDGKTTVRSCRWGLTDSGGNHTLDDRAS